MAAMRRLPWTLAALLFLGGSARADGAFPDSLSLFLPVNRPGEIVLATNFGLVTSEDDGATWHLVCEQAISPKMVLAYQMSAPPDDTLYAETPAGLAYSTDRGCTWTFSQGSLDNANVIDVFPDALEASNLYAITRTPSDGGDFVDAVYQSSDGGRSFAAGPLFTASAAVGLTGVERARSSPQTLYLTMFSYPPYKPMVARSTAGSMFDVVDETAFFSGQPYLAAVDPNDAQLLYLRVRGQSDALAISRDGGNTIGMVFPMAGRMSAFLRRSSGTLLVGSVDRQSLRSTDGGQSFAAWPNAPHVRALGERGGVLYSAADDARDGFAMAHSSDEGAHWTPILHFRDILGPLQCGNLPTVCAGPWATLQGIFGSPDAGMPASPGSPAPADAGAAPPPRPTPARRGCGCAVGGQPTSLPMLPLAILAAVLLRVRATRKRRGGLF
jgi:MYXO-CTERM domain-containing protein